VRNHWTMENRVHHVRDLTCDGDRRRAHVRNLPRNLSCLTNAAIAIVRRDGLPATFPRPTAIGPPAPGRRLKPSWFRPEPDLIPPDRAGSAPTPSRHAAATRPRANTRKITSRKSAGTLAGQRDHLPLPEMPRCSPPCGRIKSGRGDNKMFLLFPASGLDSAKLAETRARLSWQWGREMTNIGIILSILRPSCGNGGVDETKTAVTGQRRPATRPIAKGGWFIGESGGAALVIRPVRESPADSAVSAPFADIVLTYHGGRRFRRPPTYEPYR